MSETPTTPAPELLSAERLAEIQAFVDHEWPHAGSSNEELHRWRDADDLLAHAAAQAEQIRLLTMWADSAEWAVAEMRAQWAAAEARAAEAEAQVAMLRVELAEQESEKLALVNEITARDKGENAAIWRLTRMITDTFQDYGKKWGGPAVKNDKRFWAGIEDDWYDEIKTALWPTRDND